MQDTPVESFADTRAKKMARLRPRLRSDMTHSWEGGRVNYLTDALRQQARIVETTNVSSHGYDGALLDLVRKYDNGLVLDCGAGSRPDYYENVVNLEIVRYPSTDVLSIGEELPFLDETFDAVLSIAVLEHVRDPFRCAAEIARVLKPGGELLCAMPFLQPLHGYPHHYFNATHQGVRRLFEDYLDVTDVTVPPSLHPVFALNWILGSWLQGLSGTSRENFLNLRVADLVTPAPPLLAADFAKSLPQSVVFELACGFLLTARKAAPGDIKTPPAGFDEAFYLGAYPDVRAAVASGQFASGRAHFEAFGRQEGRRSSLFD